MPIMDLPSAPSPWLDFAVRCLAILISLVPLGFWFYERGEKKTAQAALAADREHQQQAHRIHAWWATPGGVKTLVLRNTSEMPIYGISVTLQFPEINGKRRFFVVPQGLLEPNGICELRVLEAVGDFGTSEGLEYSGLLPTALQSDAALYSFRFRDAFGQPWQRSFEQGGYMRLSKLDADEKDALGRPHPWAMSQALVELLQTAEASK